MRSPSVGLLFVMAYPSDVAVSSVMPDRYAVFADVERYSREGAAVFALS